MVRADSWGSKEARWLLSSLTLTTRYLSVHCPRPSLAGLLDLGGTHPGRGILNTQVVLIYSQIENHSTVFFVTVCTSS